MTPLPVPVVLPQFFAMRRGRPRKNHPKQDFGTPELQSKRAWGLTREPLDELRAKALISEPSHQAGLHLRWLYSLVHGIPAPSSAFRHLMEEGGMRQDTPRWRERREREYRALAFHLHQQGHLKLLLALCVYGHASNQPPERINAAFKTLENEMGKLLRA